jgi:hypothetical protein
MIDILQLPDTDFGFYIDADAVVVNPENSLDRIVTALGDKDLLIGEDWPGHINAGVWIVRPSGLDILKFWETVPSIEPRLCYEWPLDEAGFSDHVYPKFKDRIVFKRRHELNLVNGFIHHQMVGSQEAKRLRMRQFTR